MIALTVPENVIVAEPFEPEVIVKPAVEPSVSVPLLTEMVIVWLPVPP